MKRKTSGGPSLLKPKKSNFKQGLEAFPGIVLQVDMEISSDTSNDSGSVLTPTKNTQKEVKVSVLKK